MISYFPKIYNDELMYSVVSRYHNHTGNINLKDTIYELFDDRNLVATLEFQGKIENLVDKFPREYGINSEILIKNHTLFPLYMPFLPDKRKLQLLDKMRFCDGKSIKTKIGFIAGSIAKKKGIMYCPLCAYEEKNQNGESYIHRLHQVQGVLVCPKHGCFLKEYYLKQNNVSRVQFINFIINNEGFEKIDYVDDMMEILVEISKGAEFLLNNDLFQYNYDRIRAIYKVKLAQRGLVTGSSRIRQKELYDEFSSFYNKQILEILDCEIGCDNEYNWLKVLVRNSKRSVHPIRHILFMIFLSGSVEVFFKENNFLCDNKPMIRYPCLNPFCKNYKELTLEECKVKEDYKTKELIGTFSCDCGFIYSRKMKLDIYKVGRIKAYGQIWEQKLKELIIARKYSLREIGRQASCDPKTVIRYADKLGVRAMIDSNIAITYGKGCKKLKKQISGDEYRKQILDELSKNIHQSRNEIRSKFPKQYTWLYRHDKEWLYNNLPSGKIKQKNVTKHKVDWDKRDLVILELIRKEYSNLLTSSKSTRITKSVLGRKINKLATLEKHADKIPKTMAFLNEVIESVDEFQIRRVKEVYKKKFSDNIPIAKWKILRQAGLGKSLRDETSCYIDNIINQYRLNNG